MIDNNWSNVYCRHSFLVIRHIYAV